ncbi:hypothetical protein [Cohnella silvisoli]|uniref:Uncharacterized protein n=1 Tax=Cohnella silvisoli TaxID=2873699 RepID=A0ABV1KQR2_9BACL|nr:hypothetical protein [Cohnella silvisoli]
MVGYLSGRHYQPLNRYRTAYILNVIRSLDEKELENESFEALSGEAVPKIFPQDEAGQSMRWGKFKTKDSRIIFDIVGTKVFPFIKEMNGANISAFSRYMQDAMFLVPTPQVLQKMITGLDELYERDIKDLDMQGDLYSRYDGPTAGADAKR